MIGVEKALAIARARAAELGWALVEPLSVTERRSWRGVVVWYNVVSDPLKRGAKARFTIDASSGAVVSEGYIPR